MCWSRWGSPTLVKLFYIDIIACYIETACRASAEACSVLTHCAENNDRTGSNGGGLHCVALAAVFRCKLCVTWVPRSAWLAYAIAFTVCWLQDAFFTVSCSVIGQTGGHLSLSAFQWWRPVTPTWAGWPLASRTRSSAAAFVFGPLKVPSSRRCMTLRH